LSPFIVIVRSVQVDAVFDHTSDVEERWKISSKPTPLATTSHVANSTNGVGLTTQYDGHMIRSNQIVKCRSVK